MPSWNELPEEVKRRLPAPPERESFTDDESFEEARGYWQSHVGRIAGYAMRQYESSKRLKPEKTLLVEEIKATLLSELDEWLGFDVPDEGSEDYKTWVGKSEAINQISSIEDVISYAEKYVSNSEEFLGKWGLST